MKKHILILVCFLMVLSGIGVVNAETLTGTISGTNISTQSVSQSSSMSGSSRPVAALYATTFQNTGNLKSIVLWTKFSMATDTGAPSGATVPVTIRIANSSITWTGSDPYDYFPKKRDGRIVGTGTLGYQRVYNTATPPVEQVGSSYIFLAIDSWDLGSETGTQYLYLEYNRNQIYNLSYAGYSGGSSSIPGTGFVDFSVTDGTVLKDASGNTIQNLADYSVSAEYTATKPSGIGITGSVIKRVGGVNYTSQAIIYNALTGAIVASDSTLTSSTYNFSTVAESIIIGIKDGKSNIWNSSTLFSSGSGIPTPTVTPTTAPTIAPGYIRTTVKTIDGTSGNEIHGSNIFLKDVEGGTWSNSTSDGDGSHYIDTLPYHTINAYGTFTAFADHYSDAEALGLSTGYYGGFTYYLSMFPPSLDPGAGNVNLYVSTREADTYDIIRNAGVTITVPGGASQGGNTGSTGTEIFVVPNQSVINIAASKAGYIGSNTVVNSGTGTTASATVYLTRQTITPTVTRTVVPGETTVRPTVDPNDPTITGSTNAKGQEMMNWIAMNGMDLVQLCFMVTILGLLGIKLGK